MWVESYSDGADVVDVDGRLAERDQREASILGGIT